MVWLKGLVPFDFRYKTSLHVLPLHLPHPGHDPHTWSYSPPTFLSVPQMNPVGVGLLSVIGLPSNSALNAI